MKPIDYNFGEIKNNGVNFKMANSSTKIVINILKDNGLTSVRNFKKALLIWSNSGLKTEFYPKLTHSQKVNHFPLTNQITRKDFLFLNMIKIQDKFPNHFNFIPNSFILPQDVSYLL